MKNWNRGFNFYLFFSNQIKVAMIFALFSRVVSSQEFLCLKDSILSNKKVLTKNTFYNYQFCDSVFIIKNI